jgi:aryl-alcohol dehydrogenase-like predicted oxidoreductase
LVSETSHLGRLRARTLGFGCFSLTGGYGPVSEADAEAVLARALDLGVSLVDTSDAYAGGRNEELVGRVIRRRRPEAVVATKFGWVLDHAGKPVALDSSPAWVRRACEASLTRLQVERIDLYQQHRVDPAVPIEETAGAVARLVEEGKVGHFGLSEAAPATIRRAHRILSVATLQTEYSIWWREPERELLPLCQELGITYIAYSPLGRGLLAGSVSRRDQLGPDDARYNHPRFAEQHIDQNAALVSRLNEVAASRGCSTGQLALAWILAQPWNIVPIPSTRNRQHVEENARALTLELSSEDLAAIETAMPAGSGSGARHPEGHLPTIDH